jgi:imidazolonepropionase-like amidohydrolase
LRVALTLLLLLLALPVFAEDGFVIVGARVFDGETIRDNVTVVVQGDRITAVIENTPFNPKPGLKIVSGKGKTLLPGLIDCHTHPLRHVGLRQTLAFGVTTSLSMMNRPAFGREVMAAQAKGELRDLADFYGAGDPVTPPGGHGTQFGIPIPTVSGVDKIPAFVAKRVADGASFIKIIYEHGEPYGQAIPGLSEDELVAAVKAAQDNERLAVVHVSSLREGLAAFRAGADGLVHVWMDAVPTAKDLATEAQKPFVVPTLSVVAGIARTPGDPAPLANVPAFQPYLVPGNRTNLLRSWIGFELQDGAGLAIAQRATKALFDAGYPILAGSDAPNPGVIHGASLHGELELLVAAGLTPLQALRAATSAAATAFKLLDRGRIAKGLRADLILVTGDPTKDVTATRKIARVWKAGTEFDRAGYANAVAADVARLDAIPAPPGLGAGLAADFEAGATAVPNFGSFFPSTDALRGGDSTVRITVVPGGPGESKHCLRVEGTVTDTAKPFPWSSVFFAPAPMPMTPANLSSASGIRFKIRGKGPIYLGVMAQRLGLLPALRHLTVSEEWQEVRFTWAALDGLDGKDVSGFMFGADAPGDYWLELDELRFDSHE